MAEVIAGFIVGGVAFTLGMLYERRKWTAFFERGGVTVIDQYGEKFGSATPKDLVEKYREAISKDVE